MNRSALCIAVMNQYAGQGVALSGLSRRVERDIDMWHAASWALVLLLSFVLFGGGLFNQLWFDEGYTVALARRSLEDIWRIGAADVHPILSYVLFHIVGEVTGHSVVAYRLISDAGLVLCAALGPMCIRRDFGSRAGFLFAASILFTPNYLYLANQARMYAWAIFGVSLCMVMALRIMRSANGEGAARAPVRVWVVFVAGSQIAAWMHYYGVMTAFVINAMVLVCLIRQNRRRDLIIFIVQAVLQVSLYAPWLVALLSQLVSVSNGFWIGFHGPDTFASWFLFPLLTSGIVDLISRLPYAVRFCGSIVLCAGVLVGCFALCLNLVCSWGGKRFGSIANRLRSRFPCLVAGPALFWKMLTPGIAVFAGVFAIASVACHALGTVVLYWRYLSIPFAAVLVAASSGSLARVPGAQSGHDGACDDSGSGHLPGAGSLGRRTVKLAQALPIVLLIVYGAGSYALSCALGYASDNQRAMDAVCAASESATSPTDEGGLPLVSIDITQAGTVSMSLAGARVYYAGWLDDSWSGAYEAYEPELVRAESLEDAGLDAGDEFVFLACSKNGRNATEPDGYPSSLKQLLERGDVRLERVEAVPRPYESTWYVIARCTVLPMEQG